MASSGGVDSSVAALLCKSVAEGTATATMKLHCGGEQDEENIARAKRLAGRLGLPHYVFDFSSEFAKEVIENFKSEYVSGRTPNPCIVCNKKIKFGAFLRSAFEMGFDTIATGHYARIEKRGSAYFVRKARDEAKDQSYVLYNLTQEILPHVLMPLGDLTKNEVKYIAREKNFETVNAKESQDICFVPHGNYIQVLEKLCDTLPSEGDVVACDGKILGRHSGLHCYTIGQRKGLGIASTAPLYVVGKNVSRNTVILGAEEQLYSRQMTLRDVNFISGNFLLSPLKCRVKTRYKQKELPAVLFPLEQNKILVEFEEPVRAITSGQSAVFYLDDYLLGGGIIV